MTRPTPQSSENSKICGEETAKTGKGEHGKTEKEREKKVGGGLGERTGWKRRPCHILDRDCANWTTAFILRSRTRPGVISMLHYKPATVTLRVSCKAYMIAYCNRLVR